MAKTSSSDHGEAADGAIVAPVQLMQRGMQLGGTGALSSTHKISTDHPSSDTSLCIIMSFHVQHRQWIRWHVAATTDQGAHGTSQNLLICDRAFCVAFQRPAAELGSTL